VILNARSGGSQFAVVMRHLGHLGARRRRHQVKAFIVENKTTPGFSVEKIQTRSRSRLVQNGEITRRMPRPEANRLQATRHSATRPRAARALSRRLGVDGCQMARMSMRSSTPAAMQFGTRSGRSSSSRSFLAKMLANVTASRAWVVRLANWRPKAR